MKRKLVNAEETFEANGMKESGVGWKYERCRGMSCVGDGKKDEMRRKKRGNRNKTKTGRTSKTKKQEKYRITSREKGSQQRTLCLSTATLYVFMCVC